MPGSVTPEGPSVALSFANNFWGKDDAGVSPLLERMQDAKVSGDELKAFYTARAQIEDEYARKLLNLARKPLGSSEAGTLRASLDVVRGEVEVMGKAHQQVAVQMKGELEEPLSAFSGGIKERRKIVQSGIEKLLKTKMQQTATVNKARDKYESDCLKIKGYLAQGHMVMGQEEKKNKAKLEKTQIQMSSTSNEYEAVVKILEETTTRWNREWKLACDKFQDLEEERIDFMKSSLWSFANIASTVCVSDDASCEKIRLCLEECDVEKDIVSFIKNHNTGQEIPDAPKFINFCRGDITDNVVSTAEESAYSVAQFRRAVNPAFRTSSPQPKSNPTAPSSREPSNEPMQIPDQLRVSQNSTRSVLTSPDEIPEIPHNNFPMDGMTQFCRIGPPSDRSSIPSPTRPESRDARSEYSNPTSISSYEVASGHQSPVKQFSNLDDKQVQKRKSGFFQNHSPFRRKSKHEKEQTITSPTTTRNGWSSMSNASSPTKSASRQSRNANFQGSMEMDSEADLEPVDPRANFQLNVGNNVFDVASPEGRNNNLPLRNQSHDADPIAQALAELKGVTKHTSLRVSADRYHGLTTPVPPVSPGPGDTTPRPFVGQEMRLQHGRTPPPSYDASPQSRLGAPEPAFTSKQMQQTTANYIGRRDDVFNSPNRHGEMQQSPNRPHSSMGQRPNSRNGRPHDAPPRAASPNPLRSASPRPYMNYGGGNPMPRATSPNPYVNGHGHGHNQYAQQQTMGSPGKHPYPGSQQGQLRSRSPAPAYNSNNGSPNVIDEDMSLQLAPLPQGSYPVARPTSQFYGDGPYSAITPQAALRPRGSGSMSGQSGVMRTKSGRPILHYSRAKYTYQAVIPEELSFGKGDKLAILRYQDDGWWEAELADSGRAGLVPSNYLQPLQA